MAGFLKRFSHRANAASSDAVSNYMDTSHFDRQLEAYETLLYAGFKKEDALLHAPSQRYRWLVGREGISLKLLLSGGESLQSMLDGLIHVMTAMRRHNRRQVLWRRFTAGSFLISSHYARIALGQVKESYCQMLQEASLLSAVLAVRLNAWYERRLPMESLGVERFYHGECEEEDLFFQVAEVISGLDQQHISGQVLSSGGSAGSGAYCGVEQGVLVFLAEKRRLAQQNLMPLGLSVDKLSHLHKQRQSFWKGERYQAKLEFIWLSYRRSLNALEENDYRSQWFLLQDAIGKMQVAAQRLSRIVHRKTRRLYQRAQETLAARQSTIVMFGLRQHIDREGFVLDNKLLSRWLQQVFPHLEDSWRLVLVGLETPAQLNLTCWMEAFKKICDGLEILNSERDALLKRLVHTQFLPCVMSARHPAYPLVYAYAKTEAYSIMQPTFNDILSHFSDDHVWGNQQKAVAHVIFLIAGGCCDQDLLSYQLGIVIQELALRAFFVAPFHSLIWKRLEMVSAQYALTSAVKQRLSGIQRLPCFKDPENSPLAKSLLAEMMPDQVRCMHVDPWVEKLKEWDLVLEFIFPVVRDLEHPYHLASKQLLQKMIEHLLILSQDFYIIKTNSFRQLLERCHCHSVDESCQQSLADRLSRWDEPAVSPQDHRLVNDLPIVSEGEKLFKRVLDSLYTTMAKLTEISTSAEKRVLKNLEGLNLSRQDLQLLSKGVEVLDADQSVLLSLLKATSATVFAGYFCRQQAEMLLIIISSESSVEIKNAAISQYLDCASSQSRTCSGMYREHPDVNEGHYTRPVMNVI